LTIEGAAAENRLFTYMKRRQFLRGATLAAVAATGLPEWFLENSLAAEPPAAKDKDISVALIGCGGMGRGNLKDATRFGRVVAVCDVDENHANAASAEHGGAKTFNDFRKLLDQKDIQAVIVATPDHWHTLVNLYACKAGKDIYSQKPLTLTIDEGKRLVKAVKNSKVVFQTGSQQRSDAKFRLACELVQNGRIGKLKNIVVNLPEGLRDGPFSESPVPPGLNWDFWQGQAPAVPYVKQRCHATFRYWWEYSGGTMTDWGAHHNDIALWGLGMDHSGPTSIEAKPRVEMIPGGYTAYSKYEVHYTYANGVTQVTQSTDLNGWDGSVRKKAEAGQFPHGVQFVGSNGWIFVTRGRLDASDPDLISTPLDSSAKRLYVSNDHMKNFFDCIRSRKETVCPAEIGHRSVSVCHLGVIALRSGKKLNWDPQKEQFVGDSEANKWLARGQRKPYSYEMVA
jgi:predicted dehydrogenase